MRDSPTSRHAGTRPDERAPRIRYEYKVAIVFLLGLFMELLDMTVVNVAIPTLQQDFNASLSEIEWVITGYLLALAVFIPVAGFLADRFGSKRTFMLALTIFTVASLGAGLAWSLESLVAFRFLQGAGGGMLTPVGIAMVFRAFPRDRRAIASAFVAIPAALAPALGPVLGAYLVEYQSWHWIFLLNVPIGIVGLFLGWRWLLEDRVHPFHRFDGRGFALSAAGFTLLLFGLSQAATHDWLSAQVAGTIAAGLLALAALAYVEVRAIEPMLDVRLLEIRSFLSANTVIAVAMAAMMAGLFLIPLFLQGPGGESVLESGLVTFTQAFGILVGMPLAAKLHGRVGTRALVLVGLALVMLSSWLFTSITPDVDLMNVRVWMAMRGFGMALVFVSGQLALFGDVPHGRTARASSLFNVSRQVAASIGVAITATVLSSQLAADLAAAAGSSGGSATQLATQVSAFQAAFWIPVALAGVGLVAAIWLPHGRPAHEASLTELLSAGEGTGSDPMTYEQKEPQTDGHDELLPGVA
ncbi:MAG: MDR family MFS transporter [Chloroflexota bacterium]